MSGKMMEDINAALGVCWKRRAGFGSQRELLQSVAHYVDERRDESNQAAQYRSINTFPPWLVASPVVSREQSNERRSYAR